MFLLQKAPMAIKPRAKPAKPPEIQVLPCPAGQLGTITQERVCTFDYGLAFNWSCTEWQTTIEDCQPAEIDFITTLQPFDPPMSGHVVEEGLEQTYGPTSVTNGGYTMTLTYHVYVKSYPPPTNLAAVSDLTIVFDPPASGTINVFWDRDYATFPSQTADPSGTNTWLEVPSSEWTSNQSQFTITLVQNA